MSSGARILLGIVGLLFAIGFAWLAMSGAVDRDEWLIWVFAIFCLLISLSCIPGKHRKVTVRSIGGIIFAASLWYLFAEIRSPNHGITYTEPSYPKAILFFVTIGLPSGYVMCFNRYPRWGKHWAAFNQDDKKSDQEEHGK